MNRLTHGRLNVALRALARLGLNSGLALLPSSAPLAN